MYAEVFAVYGIFVFLLILVAEISSKKPLGMLAGLLMILLGVWLIGDTTIYLRTGESATLYQVDKANNTFNTSLSGLSALNTSNYTSYNETLNGIFNRTDTLNYSKTTAYTYTQITAPYFTLSSVLALFLLATGLYTLYAYAVDTFTQPIQ